MTLRGWQEVQIQALRARKRGLAANNDLTNDNIANFWFSFFEMYIKEARRELGSAAATKDIKCAKKALEQVEDYVNF